MLGIVVKEQNLPSGVYSALENANITGSVLNSYNDVKLRWIAYEKWTYTLNFDGKLESFFFNTSFPKTSFFFIPVNENSSSKRFQENFMWFLGIPRA